MRTAGTAYCPHPTYGAGQHLWRPVDRLELEQASCLLAWVDAWQFDNHESEDTHVRPTGSDYSASPRRWLRRTHERRCSLYPLLNALVPCQVTDIVNDVPPWYCHGLALRMATFKDEKIFQRFEELLELVEEVPGWAREKRSWKAEGLRDYERFFSLLWMLQCAECFLKQGATVEFLVGKQAAPDLKVTGHGGAPTMFYAECYMYSKWWFVEAFLEGLLWLLGPDLCIKRSFNLRGPNLGKTEQRAAFLDAFSSALSDEALATARSEARVRQPIVLCEQYELQLLVEGSGSYIPQQHDHGCPARSLEVFLKEIVKNKAKSNGLANAHPNLVMANGLGPDFQNALGRVNDVNLDEIIIEPIDAVLLAACGIDDALLDCSRKILRSTANHPSLGLLGFTRRAARP
jgi:hypothetical protein